MHSTADYKDLKLANPDLPYLCIGLCFTAPDREHVTNSIGRPW
jgi:hypothetical protein